MVALLFPARCAVDSLRGCRVLAWLMSLFLLGLASCASVPQADRRHADARAVFSEREARFAGVDEWRLAGRLLLELPGESWAGQLSWRSQGGVQVIDLSGAMGRGGGRLLLDQEVAVLITRDGDRYEAEDPDALLAQIAGRQLPVRGLAYWVRALPRPDAAFTARADAQGWPAGLIQDGWEILYGSFDESSAIPVPMSVELRRGDVSLRISVQRWQIAFFGENS